MKSFGVDAEWIPGVERPPSAQNDSNDTVGKPHKRRFRRRATPAKRGIGPGCWPTEVGGLAGRLRAVWRAHGVKMSRNAI
jgi:hypothetical protein